MEMKNDFKRNVRKWSAPLIAVICYFLIHEGAHLIYAYCIGVFKQINIFGLDIEIDVYSEQMTDIQIGIISIIGAAATITTAYIILMLTNKILKTKSHYFKAIMYYVVLAFLIIDPIYLSLIASYVSGEDLDGIALFIPEIWARVLFGVILIINIIVFMNIALPKYYIDYLNNKIDTN